MAITTTTRLGLTRWGAGADTFTRTQLDDSHASLENKGAAFIQGTTRPTASDDYKGFFYYDTSTNQLSYCAGASEGWVGITGGEGNWGSPSALVVGGGSSDGTSTSAARADHVHALPAFGSVVSVGSAPSDGVATTIARSDHVHAIGAGAINSSAMFASGVVDAAALSPDAIPEASIQNDSVTTAKIAPLAVTTNELDDDAVTAAKIASGAVGASEIANGTVGTAELASGVYGSVVGLSVGGATSNGASATLARADHTHAIPGWGTAVSVGILNNAGSANTFARSDHVHSLGTGSVNTSAVIADGVIKTQHIQAGAVTNVKLGSDLDASKITAGTLAAARLPQDIKIKWGGATQTATIFVSNNAPTGTDGEVYDIWIEY